MALTDFFRINMPYGMERNDQNQWRVFNREYKPIGFNTREELKMDEYPIWVEYPGLSDSIIKKIAHEGFVIKNDQGQIIKFWFYNDASNPTNYNSKDDDQGLWSDYFNKLQLLAKFKKK